MNNTGMNQSKSAPAMPTSTTSSIRRKKPKKPLLPNAIKLDNNNLETIAGLDTALDSITSDIARIKWVDLSFNHLTSIEDALLQCPRMTTLNLHSNDISKLKDLKILRKFKFLTKLSLHGNPVEDHKHYRNYVLTLVPTLKQIDFSSVTRQDRKNADTWKQTYRQMLAGKRRDKDD